MVTALAALVVFVGYDTSRSIDEAEDQVRLIARTLAAEVATASPNAADLMLVRLSADLPKGMHVSYTPAAENGDGNPLLRLTSARASNDNLSAARVMPAGLGTLTVTMPREAVMSGVWQRGTVLGTTLVFIMLGTWRRRRPEPVAKPAETDTDALIARLPFGVACWSPGGTLLSSNEHYRTRLGLAQRDDAKVISYNDAVKKLMAGGYMHSVTKGDNNRLLELHREDGSCILIDERPLPSGGMMTLLMDVTERKRTDLLLNSIREEQRELARRYHEEKLKAEAASRAKTSFLAHLSHDIRTPLNHIIGFADLIGHQTYGPLGDRRYVGYVESIKSSGERLLASFASILELAELEGGQKVLREERLNADDLLAATARRFGPQAERSGVTFKLGAPCGADLLGDNFCLQRMLGNLVENALRFTASGGTISLAAYAATDGIVLEVSDTGIGMSEERLQALSQPFGLGDAAFTREHGGAGLGIAIARAIAELSGGHLVIDSSPAIGTTVAISLPLAPAMSSVSASNAA